MDYRASRNYSKRDNDRNYRDDFRYRRNDDYRNRESDRYVRNYNNSYDTRNN